MLMLVLNSGAPSGQGDHGAVNRLVMCQMQDGVKALVYSTG